MGSRAIVNLRQCCIAIEHVRIKQRSIFAIGGTLVRIPHFLPQ
jgi:hypothetical protein